MLSQVPTEDDWNGIFLLAQEHTLIGVLFHAVKNLPAEQRPPLDLYFQWFALADKIRTLSQQVNKRTTEAVDKFEKDGFQCVVLKGQGISLLYPDPLSRTPGDIDLWVMDDRKRVVDYVLARAPEECVVYHNITYPLFEDVEMEVHFTPSWSNWYLYNRRLQRFFEKQGPALCNNKCTLPGCNREVAVPTRLFNSVFVLHHIYRHLFGDGIGLRQVLDFYYVIKDGFDEHERQYLVNTYKELGMYRFATAMMFVMNRVLGLQEDLLVAPMNESEGRYLLEEIMKAGNFGKYDTRIVHRTGETKIEGFFRINKQVVRHLFHYPLEVIGSPMYRVWHYCWRRWHGYRIR